jgi:hypothetical protein
MLSDGNVRFRVPATLKPLNRSRLNFARLITSVSLPDVSKMVGIGWPGTAPQMGEI